MLTARQATRQRCLYARTIDIRQAAWACAQAQEDRARQRSKRKNPVAPVDWSEERLRVAKEEAIRQYRRGSCGLTWQELVSDATSMLAETNECGEQLRNFIKNRLERQKRKNRVEASNTEYFDHAPEDSELSTGMLLAGSLLTPARRGPPSFEAIAPSLRTLAELIYQNGAEVAASMIGLSKQTVDRRINEMLKSMD